MEEFIEMKRKCRGMMPEEFFEYFNNVLEVMSKKYQDIPKKETLKQKILKVLFPSEIKSCGEMK